MIPIPQLTLGSLFDGSGTCPLAAQMLGIQPLWASEIEPYPVRVTTLRFPQMAHLGDITQLDGAKTPPVDIIAFGSPCQDLSIAGNHYGLHGSRSSLFFEAIRIIREMRKATNGKYPRFIVWENVKGALSSRHGADFHAVLQQIARLKDESLSLPRPSSRWPNAGALVGEGYSLAWRLYDAQYWGVPQRRKRIYLVADFAGECAGEILFKPESGRWHPQKSGDERKSAPSDGAGSPDGVGRAVAYPIDQHQQDARFCLIEDGVFPTLNRLMGTGGNNTPMVLIPMV